MHNQKRFPYAYTFLFHFVALFALLLSLSFQHAHAVQSDKTQKAALQQYEQLGSAYAEAIGNRDMKGLTQLFDMEAFARKTAGTVFSNEKDIDNFVKGMMKNPEEAFLQRVFSSAYQNNAKVKYLRVINNTRPLIRFDYQEGGHEYIVLDTEHSADKTLKVVDMFVLSAGKKLSDNLGSATQLMFRPSKSFLKKLFNKVEVDQDVVGQFRKLTQLRTNKQYKEAYDLIDSMPEVVKNKRIMIDFAIQLSQAINEKEYRKQLSRLDKYHGNDESTTFLLIDHHYYNKNYLKAQKSLDRLIASYGVDGALLNLKASTYLAANDLGKAEKQARRAIKVEPHFEDSHWTLVTVLASADKFSKLVKALKTLQSQFGYAFEKENFAGNDIYAKFIKSREFKAWLK